MATKRRSTSRRGTGGKRRPAAQTQAAGRGRSGRRGARTGAREARREAAARRVEADAGAPALRLADAGHDPELEQAAALEGEAAERPEEAAERGPGRGRAAPSDEARPGMRAYARLVADQDVGEEAAAEREGERAPSPARLRAQDELTRRREEAEGRVPPLERGPSVEVPGLADIGLEIALGALRLARTLATAPLRIALAFLRPLRDA